MNINYYQSIPEAGIKGRMNTPEEFEKIGLPKDLTGWSVLDIGCNIGAFLFECHKRGAAYLSGIEVDNTCRWLCQGIAEDLNIDVEIGETIYDIVQPCDLVLLLSVTHVTEGINSQDLLNKAYASTKKLLIVEINDRLQNDSLKLPDGAKCIGKNKDNRSVWHIQKI